jgi:SAM-dependent methyltransferase
MPITLLDIEFLLSVTGESLLQRLRGENLSKANTLRLLTTLRKDYTAEQAGAAVEMARLRLKAVDKFGDDAASMFFTRDALEQASDPLIRDYRAELIGAQILVDAGCGIGADSLAFAKAGADVIGLDIDHVRVEIARYNARVLGLKARFEVVDIRDGLPPSDVVFFDPARRDDQGKRIYDVERYQPPLSIVRTWKQPSIIVKLSPGVDLDQLKNYAGLVNFISVAGDLKEALLSLGGGMRQTRATLLRPGEHYFWEREVDFIPETVIAAPRGWLIEPDPATLRAGLVQDVAAQFNGSMLDETIAYFTTDTKPESPWIRAWQILDWMPFNVKKLRAYLRQHNVGTVTMKKRGSPVTPEALIPQLKLKGSASRTLVLTRFQGQPIVIICAPYSR